MAYTPQQLRHLAKHCRTLAIISGCGRPQLLGLAKEFEAEALAEEKLRSPLGRGAIKGA